MALHRDNTRINREMVHIFALKKGKRLGNRRQAAGRQGRDQLWRTESSNKLTEGHVPEHLIEGCFGQSKRKLGMH